LHCDATGVVMPEKTHAPVAGLHESTVHTLLSVHVLGVSTQAPVPGWHVLIVQRLGALHVLLATTHVPATQSATVQNVGGMQSAGITHSGAGGGGGACGQLHDSMNDADVSTHEPMFVSGHTDAKVRVRVWPCAQLLSGSCGFSGAHALMADHAPHSL
jgi:hypothetical protein